MDWSQHQQIEAELAREGLGVSVAIYAGAIFVALAVVAVPIYAAISPKVYENPPPEPLDPLLQGPIIGKRVSTPMPLAYLKHPVLVDPDYVAQLNAKNRKGEPSRAHVATQHTTPARERGPAVAELPERRERQGFFLFNLFGG